ncbi:BglG family transcription antiterminator [Gilliamella sp. B2840]|uniref:BglG family transcription antiterminator n=1 Tax=unclassified Gilliamella TaxID=2685620 RepID=UPI00226A6093|nr:MULTISPECIES: transcription antiterminator [unclassified Gilliamella]MCX8655308.1 BglG family transcription antiterminator [Gilliamella sp. B2894]MCX8664791.1 BglG family transcription antiterminator [Gilliamella sp. B2887]MCX8694376.1 BglG family transcription antiterminator [Gilliamella sp. B2881]MCX8695970.1 BglG family transcription antiterminator [Gilliamella sp. B2828]MCX8697386.1 BglG family transcription antiterminator [Gilliamella sp. B3000]
MIKHKQRELISLLVRSKNGYKSSQELATELSLSDRTVRTYLKDLKTLIECNGGNIVSKQGYGFQLKILDRTSFNLFLIEHHLFEKNIEQSQCREASERKHFILNLLLLESQKVDIEDLSEQLFISSSQLNKDIAEIKSQLLTYELTLKKNRSLIFVDGEEKAKRHFIMSYFFHEDSINFLHHLSYFNQSCEAISFDTLTIIILDECREAHIKLSDVMIQNIVLHLSLSIKRLQSGLSIQNLNLPVSTNTTVEYHVAYKIIARIESIIGFHFPKQEQMYLTLHLMSKSNLIQDVLDDDLCSSLTNLLLKIQQETTYPFWHDEQLKNGLIQHLKPMLVRLEQNIKLENPLIDEIKSQYFDVFVLVKHYLSQLPNLHKYEVNDDEWGYLALHFLASLEKLKNEQKVKVLIICATGLGSAQLLKNRVESEFDERVKIVATRGYYEIEPEMINDIDFIISSVDLSSKVFKVPVFHVSVFFCEEDVQAIRRYLSHRQVPNLLLKDALLRTTDHKKQNHLNYISQIFDDIVADYFHLCQQKPDKQTLLNHLLDSLSVNEEKNFKHEMKKQMEKRMTIGEILFSPTIVVPHPAIPVGKITKIAIAVIPDGLFWDEDYQDIKFVFMISPSIYQNSNLAMMTKAIINLIDDLSMQQAMLEISDFNQFKSLFIQLIKKGA